MILSKFHHFTQARRSTTIILRTYVKSSFRPLIMPKDNKEYLIELQKQRKRIKAQSAKYSPSHIFLQIIGNGSRSDSRSVLLVTDHTNYLFNCGEGTQRLSSEHHAKLAKIEHIFVTRTEWSNMGGIPGVALTIQDTGVPKINLHGPEGTIDIMEATQNFINLNELAVVAADSSRQFRDQTMTVTYVPIKNPKESEADESVNTKLFVDNINYYDYQLNSNGKRSRSPTSASQNVLRTKSEIPKRRIDTMMVYICKIHPKAGALDIEKCLEAGIKPGPALGQLKAGNDVTLPDGTIIKGKDMVSPPEPGPLFIVLECPNEDWIDVIVQNPGFAKHQQGTAASEEEIAMYIIHFTPESVLNNSKYKEWMHKFGSKTHHLIINENNTGVSYEAMHRMQHQLHLIHPTIFPFLGDQQSFAEETLNPNLNENFIDTENLTENSKQNDSSELKENKVVEAENAPLVKDGLLINHCKTLHEVHLRPHKGLDLNNELKLHPKEYIQEVFNIDGFLDVLADLQTEVNCKTKTLGDIEEYPKLLMLGTGSSIPNKVRNTSGMLLQLDKDRSIMLDCGEGTVGQIIKFFGESQADHILKTIKAVFVSHLHADHHLGFIGLLQQRQRFTDEPLFLLAPQQISPYLYFYHNRFESITKYFKLISNRDLLMNQAILSNTKSQELYEILNVENISTSFVTHCPYAYAIAITLKDGRKICYSGDTVPCDNMMKLAEKCFLLIHEATMEDGLEAEAQLKHHSTVSQAVNVGIKANANFTLLTHFSQRYSKIPVLPSNMDLNRVGISYDFMMVRLSELPLLPLFYKGLSVMFSDFRAMLIERATKREWKKEQLVKTFSN